MLERRTRRLAFIVLAAAVMTAGALRLLTPGAIAREDDPVEVVLIARGMAFRPATDAGALNPTVRLQAGTRVRFVIKNEEPGVVHNFAIPAWRVDSGSIPGPGERRVEVVVPGKKGREAYQCTPHAAMMRGEILVE